MRVSRSQKFFANNWPVRLWLIAGTGGSSLLAVWGDPIRKASFTWGHRFILTSDIVLFGIIGFFIGVVIGAAILPPIYRLRVRLSGGPVQPGDVVMLLTGPL